MPELPEVEIIRVGLAKLLPGRVIEDVWHDWPKSFPNSPSDTAKFLLKAKIVHVRRRAKVLIIELSSNYSLVIHLKMTGQLVYVGSTDKLKAKSSKLIAEEKFGGGHPNDSLVGKLPDKSTRVKIDFSDNSKLFFNDQRKFGWMRLLPTAQVPELDFFKDIGPEPLDDDFTAAKFIEALYRRKNSNIKAVLLDQTMLAGVGNIYADESLFMAKIHPLTPVGRVSRTKLVALHSDLRQVLQLSITKGGSTDRNYVDANGKKGSYLSFAQVFRREGQPCPRCGTIIEKIRVAGRGTHICPHCQKAPK
ncbi:bifunctional DNA-formamidopyrimidine glycosylase/DNA-(apurinic or apyrimidinic site) lyase [Candidatus Saccharibacteria bacterium CG10_big_fil_rev_8_21_14_0_10_47_8]|nr:MAG: bifunctional DNA-formamidopyrimidine glycosylase/DNA-(apurinic or apyrimidinic site) lyase [Candidatus Saccharibacteria bacterium CG10_big_fil_rev_8_21_14_0_10_47_8]